MTAPPRRELREELNAAILRDGMGDGMRLIAVCAIDALVPILEQRIAAARKAEREAIDLEVYAALSAASGVLWRAVANMRPDASEGMNAEISSVVAKINVLMTRLSGRGNAAIRALED